MIGLLIHITATCTCHLIEASRFAVRLPLSLCHWATHPRTDYGRRLHARCYGVFCLFGCLLVASLLGCVGGFIARACINMSLASRMLSNIWTWSCVCSFFTVCSVGLLLSLCLFARLACEYHSWLARTRRFRMVFFGMCVAFMAGGGCLIGEAGHFPPISFTTADTPGRAQIRGTAG